MRALRRVGERAERGLLVFVLTQIAKKPMERKRKRAAIEEDQQEEDEMENGASKATCSVSSLNTHTSAIKGLHTEQGVAMKDELNRELIDLSDCYSCVVAKKRREGVMESKEGKDPLPFPAHKKIAERLFFS